MRKPIYVPTADAVKVASGRRIMAIRPACQTEKFSFAIDADGQPLRLEGKRIGGVGVESYFRNQGYVRAGTDNEFATRLTDHIAVADGLKMVEEASLAHADALQKAYEGQECQFVPFKEDTPVLTVVPCDNGCRVVVLGIQTGYCGGSINVRHDRVMEVQLGEGWLVPPGEDAEVRPRVSEYGGPVQHAIFVIANSGLATLSSSGVLCIDEDTPLNDPMPRGRVELALVGSDETLTVGIDASDELVVDYLVAGQLVFRRHGFAMTVSRFPNLGGIIGAIASAIVIGRQAVKPQPMSLFG
jgi:hypothetical protein